MARKPTDYVQVKVRMREALRRKLEKAAELRKHSANAEAVWRIERTFTQDEEIAASAEKMATREAELQKMALEHLGEIARREEKLDAALRDSKILNMMVDNKYAAMLIRLIFRDELKDNPNWAATPESKKAFGDRLHWIITHNDFEGDFE